MSQAPTYTVHKSDGTVETFEASPAMQRIFTQMREFEAKNPDFWCKCETPETNGGLIVMQSARAHSVDVFCRCGGCLQIG